MPITSTGYDQTVNEAVWGSRAVLYGAQPGVAGIGDLAVTVSGDSQVTVAAGVAHGRGVVDTLDTATVVTLGRPASGVRYDAVVLRRDWTVNTTSLVVVEGGSRRLLPSLLAGDQALALVQVDAVERPVISDDLRLTHAPTGSVTNVKAMTGPVGARYVFAQDGQRYYVSPTGPVPEWEPPAPVMPDIPVIGYGAASFTTSSAGTAVIKHGHPFTPTVIIPTRRTTMTGGLAVVTVSATDAITADSFTVNVKIRTLTGWKPYVGNMNVAWIACKRQDAPALIPGTVTPPPPPEQPAGTTPPVTDTGQDTPTDTDAAPAPQIPIPDTPPEYVVSAPQMASVAGILATAAAEIGVTESPAGSNRVKYWADELPAGQGQYWCGAFTAWVYRRNSISVNTVLAPDLQSNNPYYTPYLEAAARAKGLWYTGVPRPGDMVVYGNSKLAYGTVIGTSSTGTKIIATAKHVAIVEKWLPDVGRVQDIGGNTSDGLNGSPDNGGGVYRNRRNPNSTTFPVRGYIRMPTTVPIDLRVKGPFPLPAGHYYGVADSTTTLDHNGTAGSDAQAVKQIQAEVGATVDGVYGATTEALVRKWQAAMNRTQTGRVYVEDWNWFLGAYTAPARPTGIVATAGVKSATVTFNAVSGAQQYTANLYGTDLVVTKTESPITFTNLPPGVPVQFTVTATNVAGASDTSARSAPVYPTEGTLQTVVLADGSVIPTWAGSSSVPQLVGAVQTANRDTTTYNAFIAKVPAARFTAAAQQAARNAAAVLYGSDYPYPAARATVTFEFTADAKLAGTTSSTSTISFGRSVASTPNTAGWFTHEVVHLVQKDSPIYGTSADVRGVIEGIADYVLIRIGHHADSTRPAGGGTAWNAGYDTTGWFFKWIEDDAATPTPGFVRALNQQMSSASWTAAQITGINNGGKTVDALWAEYRAWIAAGN